MFPLRTVILIACLQFVYMLDFIMLMPLAADLAQAMGFANRQIGWLAAAYTLAALLAGLLSLRYLDRFDRKPLLLCCFAGLIAATVASTQTSDLYGLMLTRALTGFFGGPAIALGMAIVIDSTVPQQRGRAIGLVMTGFSAAVIAGVPLALEIARRAGWQAPFLLLAGCAVLVWLAILHYLPNMRAHLDTPATATSLRALWRSPRVPAAMLLQALSQFSAFLIIPHFSAFLLANLQVAREHLSLLYFIGGVCAFITVQVFGRWADQRGAFWPVLCASLAFALGLQPFFGVLGGGMVGITVCFIAFMAGNAGRNVCVATVCSQVPQAAQRARFMSMQNMVQDAAISLAALCASMILSNDAQGRLLHTSPLAMLALASVALLCWYLPKVLVGEEKLLGASSR